MAITTRYLKLVVDDAYWNSGFYIAMFNEFQALTANGTNVAQGKTATSCGAYSAEHQPSNAVNGSLSGNTVSLYVNNTAPSGNSHWWKVDLGQEYDITKVLVYNHTIVSGGGYANIKSYRILASNDDVNYTLIKQHTNDPDGISACHVAYDAIAKTNLYSMDVGDYIYCRYVGASNTAGAFTDLGVEGGVEIPVTGSVTPNGIFKFYKVDTGLLIADRSIQISIQWDKLKTAGYIEGKSLILANGVKQLIRSMSGGVANAQYINCIPAMTSNTAPSGIASASSEYSGYPAWKVFDGTDAQFSTANGAGLDQWVGYEFPTERVVNAYALKGHSSAAYLPTAWTFEGSNDGANWDVLHTVSGTAPLKPNKLELFSFKNTTAYKRYRLHMTASGGATYYALFRLEFYNINGMCISSLNTGKELGGYPNNNEYDKYICNSDLNGKIKPGDDNIWNWSKKWFWCYETPINNVVSNHIGYVSSKSHRVRRGCDISVDTDGTIRSFEVYIYYGSSADTGFRPVLEYKEDGTNIW